MKEEELKIKGETIPIIIKSFRTSKSVKIFFKKGKVIITKPTRLSYREVNKIINENIDLIYDSYKKGMEKYLSSVKTWNTGESIYYKGSVFEIIREFRDIKRASITIDESNQKMLVILPKMAKDEDAIKQAIDSGIKELFKNNTKYILQEKLPYWSDITRIEYNNYAVRDAVTRYGSCVKKTKSLRFSSRLIMLPGEVVDAIIVHELCHIVYNNHSKDFYNLVKTYIPNYKEIDRWLKKNSKAILI